MKRLALYFFCLICFCSCNRSEDQLLQQRWIFTGTNIKEVKEAAEEIGSAYDVDGYRQIFAGSKFILRKDGTFDLCIFKNYRHGKWERQKDKLILMPEPLNVPVSMNIDTLSSEWMNISIDTNEFNKLGKFMMPDPFGPLVKRKQFLRFKLELEDEKYPDTEKDPYSRENNWWRIKPLRSESDEEINKRLLNLVDFHIKMFEDAQERKKSLITYNWFSSPLIVANNGLGLDHYSKIEEHWNECFYDTAQASKAYHILEKPFSKKLSFPENEQNKFERSIKMLKIYRKHVQ